MIMKAAFNCYPHCALGVVRQSLEQEEIACELSAKLVASWQLCDIAFLICKTFMSQLLDLCFDGLLSPVCPFGVVRL